MPKIGAGEPWGSAAGHPFARLGGHEAVRLRQGGVNQAGDHADKLVGVMTQHDRAPCRVRTRSRGPGGQRADLAVAQAVVDQGEQSAGGRDHADVAAPRGDDPGPIDGQFGARAGALAGLDRRQRTSFEPCFVIGPPCTLVSDSRCRGVSPAQQHNFSGRENRVTSPISATRTAAKVGPTPLICWITR